MLFFELLQIAIGNRQVLTHTPSAEEWKELYALAQKQSLMGIAFRGIELLPQEQRPPKALLLQWYMATERIKARNAELDHKALDVANRLLGDGFPCMILKGQGIAQLYRVEQIENSKLTSLKLPCSAEPASSLCSRSNATLKIENSPSGLSVVC